MTDLRLCLAKSFNRPNSLCIIQIVDALPNEHLRIRNVRDG